MFATTVQLDLALDQSDSITEQDLSILAASQNPLVTRWSTLRFALRAAEASKYGLAADLLGSLHPGKLAGEHLELYHITMGLLLAQGSTSRSEVTGYFQDALSSAALRQDVMAELDILRVALLAGDKVEQKALDSWISRGIQLATDLSNAMATPNAQDSLFESTHVRGLVENIVTYFVQEGRPAQAFRVVNGIRAHRFSSATLAKQPDYEEALQDLKAQIWRDLQGLSSDVATALRAYEATRKRAWASSSRQPSSPAQTLFLGENAFFWGKRNVYAFYGTSSGTPTVRSEDVATIHGLIDQVSTPAKLPDYGIDEATNSLSRFILGPLYDRRVHQTGFAFDGPLDWIAPATLARGDGERLVDSVATFVTPAFVERSGEPLSIATAQVLAGSPDGVSALAELPATAVEYKEIVKTLERSLAVVSTEVGRADLVHLAAHGSVGEAGAMLLPVTGSDSVLLPNQIVDSNVSPIIVFLNGCGTARRIGDGFLPTMHEAFLWRSADVVVATLWEVDDNVARVVAGRFYSNLFTGVSAAEALRSAQESVRESMDDSPYAWGAYVLIGNGGAVFRG